MEQEQIATEEQMQAYLNDILEVDKKHGLELCATIKEVKMTQVIGTQAMLSIRKRIEPKTDTKQEVKEVV